MGTMLSITYLAPDLAVTKPLTICRCPTSPVCPRFPEPVTLLCSPLVMALSLRLRSKCRRVLVLTFILILESLALLLQSRLLTLTYRLLASSRPQSRPLVPLGLSIMQVPKQITRLILCRGTLSRTVTQSGTFPRHYMRVIGVVSPTQFTWR